MKPFAKVISSRGAFLGFALLGGFLSGCGGSGKVVYPVQGQVFVQNKPAANAFVIFTPLDHADRAQWPMGYPRGTVQDDGSFKLTTYRPNDGAPAGDYKVTILWWNGSQDDEQPKTDLLQGRYADPNTSPFRVHVANDRRGNTIEPFNLE